MLENLISFKTIGLRIIGFPNLISLKTIGLQIISTASGALVVGGVRDIVVVVSGDRFECLME